MRNLRNFILLFSTLIILNFYPAFAHNYCKNGLIAFWTFDDGTAKDVSGNGFHGTIMNSPKRIKGISGDAFYFTGRGYYTLGESSVPEGDHILLPRIPFEELGEFSITMWVKEDSMSNFSGEAYLFYGDHVNGWLGLMNVKKYEALDTILYTDYAVGAGEKIPALKQMFDFKERFKWIFYTMTYKNGILTAYRDGKYLVRTKQNIDIRTVSIGALARHWWTYDDGIRTSARFSGAIDEVKIFCKALNDKEVKEEYESCDYKDLDQLEFVEMPKPLKTYAIDFGKVLTNEEKSATLNVKNRSNTSVIINALNFQNNNFYFPQGTFPFTLAPSETKVLEIAFKNGNPGTYNDQLIINDICSHYTITLSAVVKENPCKNGLIAYWSFDDSTAKDNSGNGYDGTIQNHVEPTKGYNGKNAFRFYGVGATGYLGGHILLPPIDFTAYSEFSLSFWAWNEEPSYYHGESYISFGDQSYGWLGVNNHKLIEIDNSTLYDHFAVGANSSTKPLVVNYDYNLRKKWVYYAMTFDGDSLRAYRDGKFLGAIKQKVFVDNPSLSAIARHWWTDGGTIMTSTRFNGILDDIKIYCRKLTEEEIKEGYTSCENADLDEFEILECPKPQTSSTINIPPVKLNDETYNSIHIKNKTNNQLTINDISLKDNNFYLGPGTLPLKIGPSSTIELKIYFKKSKPGKYQDELEINDICTKYTIALNGEALSGPCKNGLIAYWSFDDSTAKDQSGNGYDGTIVNKPTFSKGYKGIGVKLHGEGNYSTNEPLGSYISLESIPFDNYNEFTISLAAKEESFSYRAGEAMVWFGLLNEGWLGIMSANYNEDDAGGNIYSHFSISSNSSSHDDYKTIFDSSSMSNKWVYYTMSYNKGEVKCYKNGELEGTFFQEAKKLQPYAAIGRHWWKADNELRSSTRYNGIIDEVKIYCKALTKEEIRQELVTCDNADLDEFEIKESPKPQKTASIDFGNALSNELKSEIVHIRNKTDQPISIYNLKFKNDNFFFASGTFPLTIAPLNEKILEVFFKKSAPGVYVDELIINDICTEYTFNLKAVVQDSPCNNGVIAYWSFDDSTANDNSGNSYDGKIMNKVLPVGGINGKTALRFFGNGSVGELGGHILLPRIDFSEYPEFTIGLWVWNEKPTYFHGETYIGFGNQSKGWLGINNHKMLNVDSPILYDHFAVGSDNNIIKPLILDFNDNFRNRWVSYVMTYRNGTLRAYRNGKFEDELSQKVYISQPELAAIARHWWSENTGELSSSTRFNGVIDEVKIRCKALTKEEIEIEYGPCALGFGNLFEVIDLPMKDSVYNMSFDTVGVGGQIVKTIKIKNKTDANVQLTSVYLSDNIHYSIPQSIFPLRFAPREEKEIDIFLLPKLSNKLRDTLVIEDVCNKYRIALEANATLDADTLNGICDNKFKVSYDSISCKYYMQLRSPRYISSINSVIVNFETNIDNASDSRELELYNSLGDLVSRVPAKITYTGSKLVGKSLIRNGFMSFPKGEFSSGLYFIKSENGMVGFVLDE